MYLGWGLDLPEVLDGAPVFLTAQSSLDLPWEDFFRPMPLLLPIHRPGLNPEEINLPL